ncbi:MAG: Rieske (2Fe-2S) protein [Steroidobacteraceae bacterium]
MSAEFICDFDDLVPAKAKLVRRDERLIAFYRIGASVYAVDAVCPHWNGPLARGQVSVERLEVICPWHRFRYSLVDGRCVAARDKRPRLRTYPVKIDEGRVYADLTSELQQETAAG